MSLVTTKGLTSGSSTTLSTTECQAMVIKLTGAINVGLTLTFSVVKEYIVDNQCTGTAAITMQAPGVGNKVSTPPGSRKRIWSDGTNMAWSQDDDHPGALKNHYGTALPSWMSAFTIQPWFICDGSTFTAATYPALNAILGGNTLPDMRGRFAATYDPTSLRLTTPQIAGNTLGATGGEQTHVLLQAELPNINVGNPTTHPNINPASSNKGTNANLSINATGGGAILGDTSNTLTLPDHVHSLGGSGTAHNTVPPAIVAGVMLIKS